MSQAWCSLDLIPVYFVVIKQADLTSAGLLEVVGNAEREKAATPSEAPLSEWEVTRIKPDYGTHLTTQVQLANSDEAKAALQVGLSSSESLTDCKEPRYITSISA